MNLGELAALLQSGSVLIAPRETTIFSIGGKGYFENPASDVLAFFLDPHQVHGFHDLLLHSFFTCFTAKPPRSMDLIEPPIREEETPERKRIDIVLIGDDWVLAIENKIYHRQNNPFSEYERHLSTRFSDKKIYCTILSPSGRTNHPNWSPVSYKNFVDKIQENIGKALLRSEFNKWHIFLIDFLIHIENYAVEREMEEDKISFIEINYQAINKLSDMRDQYHNFLQQKGLDTLRELFPVGDFTAKLDKWPEGPAIRHYSLDRWGEKSNIAIQISLQEGDQGLTIFMYAFGVPNTQIVPPQQIPLDLESWTEGRDIRCFRTRQRFSEYDSLLKRFRELAQWFDQFLRTWRATL